MADTRVSRPQSHEAFRRAKRLIPGGVNSPVRALGPVGGEPPFIARGRGAFLFDVDGNEYVDCIGGRGSLILGHLPPTVISAIEQSLHDSTLLAAPTERETQLAELIVEAIPSVEMVRFVDSGSEAMTAAIRLARGFTGRDLIVRFAGSYHGDVDSLLVATGTSPVLAGMPMCPGVSYGATNGTLVLQYNNRAALELAFSQHGDLIAAVIVEPIATNMGLVPATQDFLVAARQLTQQHDALLIFDDVTSGFRLGYGSVVQSPDAEPDITVLGKIVGGGLPIGAFGGKRHIMHRLMPTGPVMQGANLAGNTPTMAAGIATLRILRDHPPYERLDQLGQRLEDGLRDHLTSAGIPHLISRLGSMWTLSFTDRTSIRDFASAMEADAARFTRYFWAMMDRGIYVPCSHLETSFLSAAHDERCVDRILSATRDSLNFMAGFVN